MARKPETEKAEQRAPSRATGGKVKPEPRAGKHEPPAGVQPVETEDAQQIGSGKPVQREVLERNVGEDGAAEEHPETVAGQHATGSFTGRKRRAG